MSNEQPTFAELAKTFDDLAVSQDKNADLIEATAAAQGNMTAELAQTVVYIRSQAELCREKADELRAGVYGTD